LEFIIEPWGFFRLGAGEKQSSNRTEYPRNHIKDSIASFASEEFL